MTENTPCAQCKDVYSESQHEFHAQENMPKMKPSIVEEAYALIEMGAKMVDVRKTLKGVLREFSAAQKTIEELKKENNGLGDQMHTHGLEAARLRRELESKTKRIAVLEEALEHYRYVLVADRKNPHSVAVKDFAAKALAAREGGK